MPRLAAVPAVVEDELIGGGEPAVGNSVWGAASVPQARIKERFGEFAYRPSAGRGFERDPAWVSGGR